MNMPLTPPTGTDALPLSEQELRMIRTLRLLTTILPDAPDQLEYQLWRLVGKHMKWSRSDAESLNRAAAFAALDPYLKRESDLITQEFACTESDGLENF